METAMMYVRCSKALAMIPIRHSSARARLVSCRRLKTFAQPAFPAAQATITAQNRVWPIHARQIHAWVARARSVAPASLALVRAGLG